MNNIDRMKLYKELSKPFPESAVERTKADITRKGYDTTGIKYQYVVNRLNEVIGLGGFRTQQQFSISEKQSRSGNPMFECLCDLTLQIGQWDNGDFFPLGEAFASGGHVSMALCDAKKGAYTNAFKKAAAFFGCGWQAYAGVIDDDNQPPEPIESDKTNNVEVKSNDNAPKTHRRKKTEPTKPIITKVEPHVEPPTKPDNGRISTAQLENLERLVLQLDREWGNFCAYVKERYQRQPQYLTKEQASEIISELLKSVNNRQMPERRNSNGQTAASAK